MQDYVLIIQLALSKILFLDIDFIKKLSLDTDLREYGLTTVPLINLIIELESEFEIGIDINQLNADGFSTIRKITDIVKNSLKQ